jgi:hypothetical protein
MSQTLSELFETLKQAREGYGILDLFPAECDGFDSILDDEVELTPAWRINEERQRRGTGIPVDLGLSVLWSSRNVGAASGELPGLYVGWGDAGGNLTSINVDDYPCSDPPEDIGGSDCDIARERWAETWRLPTRAEVQELIQKCRWRWTVINGIPGAQIIGRNGGSIFLPAAGDRYGTDYEDAYYYGRYWTSELRPDSDEQRQAFAMEFSQMGPEIVPLVRHMGLSIRPVLEK